MNLKISIIIPVFNVEKFLPKCIDSIINQTYKDLEIIIINDGSTDSSPMICNNYAFNDSRIKVIHQKNGGLSDARNTGLKIITGGFVCFVDSDDFISTEYCELMLLGLLKNNVEIIECDFLKFKEEEAVSKYHRIEKRIEFYETEKALELLMKENIKQMVWNKLFTVKVIEGFLFETGKYHEDEFWTYKVIGNSKGIIKICDVLYFYRQNPTSIMGKSYNLSRIDGLLAIRERVYFMQKHFPKLENLSIKIFCLASLWHYQQLVRNKQLDLNSTFKKKMHLEVKEYNKISILMKWKFKEIFWFKFFIFSPNICSKFRNSINVGI